MSIVNTERNLYGRLTADTPSHDCALAIFADDECGIVLSWTSPRRCIFNNFLTLLAFASGASSTLFAAKFTARPGDMAFALVDSGGAAKAATPAVASGERLF